MTRYICCEEESTWAVQIPSPSWGLTQMALTWPVENTYAVETLQCG